MTKHTYTILLEPQDGGGFTVFVPALPEVITEGETEAEAVAMAREAIALAIAHRRAKGLDLPASATAHILEITVEAA